MGAEGAEGGVELRLGPTSASYVWGMPQKSGVLYALRTA